MKRKVLLIEPNYKNKYPPLNLMKLARYYRCECKDDVRFFKGNLKNFAAQLFIEEFFKLNNIGNLKYDNLFKEKLTFRQAKLFGRYEEDLINFIKMGKNSYIEDIPNLCNSFYEDILRDFRRRFQNEDYPKFDIICIATLFTFFWKDTIDTINFAKKFLSEDGKLYVGGIAATLVPKAIKAETGIAPHEGLLDKPYHLGKADSCIIDELPPDYSILEEIDYKYPTSNAYFGYMTRGCVRRCKFCAVPTLEPQYKNYISISDKLSLIEEQFGAKQYLLLMDNNVLASPQFDKIIDEIKECGFAKGATYQPSNEYDIAIKNLRTNYNERAYIKKIIQLYDELDKNLPEEEAANFYIEREKRFLLYRASATRNAIINFDKIAQPLFSKYMKKIKRTRYIDFNQGLDARLMTEEKAAKLAEINIKPLRIAFDHYEQRDIYERAIRLAAKYGIRHLSNYILYNYKNTPDDLYYRLKINIELCEELNIDIYSFPMKYHPISNPKYFRNRDYIGNHWNRKFIRAIQAIINATKGKIGRGRSFFEEAFGRNIDEFHDLLWMPEALIIHRFKYKYNVTEEWREQFHSLNSDELDEAQGIIEDNKFTDEYISKATFDKVREILKFYQIARDNNKAARQKDE